MFEIHPTIIIVTIDIIIITIVIIKPKDHLEIYFPEIKKRIVFRTLWNTHDGAFL